MNIKFSLTFSYFFQLSTIQPSTSITAHGAEIKIPGVGVTPVAVSTQLPAAVAQLSQQGNAIRPIRVTKILNTPFVNYFYTIYNINKTI